jgi:hypothetical protein
MRVEGWLPGQRNGHDDTKHKQKSRHEDGSFAFADSAPRSNGEAPVRGIRAKRL